ncbi:uncharacterized protein LOC111045058 [Nilaparvata lugens]|uniref:uncharacterized protein LOC111045058 n=1 Tax=Nilaparvata lugens TaxID=108931 RepID=UPI00193DAD27|nr:uncharacterized protein LOC111045058 [Nilaparvata lugens]
MEIKRKAEVNGQEELEDCWTTLRDTLINAVEEACGKSGVGGKEKEDLQHNMNIWNEELEKEKMKISMNKTKVMAVATNHREIEIKLKNRRIEQVTNFKYLGATIHQECRMEGEINSRTASGGRLYYALSRGFLDMKDVSQKAKMAVFWSTYVPTLLYSSETWTLTERRRSKLQAQEMRFLRRVIGRQEETN